MAFGTERGSGLSGVKGDLKPPLEDHFLPSRRADVLDLFPGEEVGGAI